MKKKWPFIFIIILFNIILWTIYIFSSDKIYKWFHWLIFSFSIINLILYLISRKCKKSNILQDHYTKIYNNNNKNFLYKNSSILTIIYIHVIYFLLCFSGTLVVNFIRLKSRERFNKIYFKMFFCKKNFNYYSIIDLYVLLIFFIEIIIWNLIPESIFFSSFFLLSIYSITLIKLNEVFTLEPKKSALKYEIYSLTRTLLLSIINFIELLLSFSYIYKNLNIISNLDINSIFITFNTFLSGGIFPNNNNICQTQKNYILFEMFALFIFIMIFISNIKNLSYKDDK
jgi:hypothetical protein